MARSAATKRAPVKSSSSRSRAKPKTKKGLSVKTFKGLSKKRMESKRSANFGKRLGLKQGDTVPVQFLQTPDDFEELEIHVFQEDGRWEYVPCLGDDCPLCADESETRQKTTYRFCCNVYNLQDRKVQILEGPKDLAQRIFYRYERNPARFLKRTYEINKFPTNPVTYGVDIAEEPLVKTASLKLHDLQDYVDEEAKRYYGDELPEASALDADDDDDLEDDIDDEDEDDLDDDEDLDDDDDLDEDDEDEDEDDEDDEDEDDDLDDEDDDDLDDEDDDEIIMEEDDEDDEPPARRRPAKKAPAKKAAAKKAPAKKSAARRR